MSNQEGRRVTEEELSRATRFSDFSLARLLPDGKTVVKAGTTIRETEGNTMRFIRQHTSIPVPEVYNVYKESQPGGGTGSVTVIVMEYVDGQRLDEAWPALTPDEKASVLQQLRGYFRELRQIKGDFIGSVDGSACDDQFLENAPESSRGPFKTEAEFNQALANVWLSGEGGHEEDPFRRLLVKILFEVGRGHEIVLTHNDFAARNILVRGSTVVAILDWEFAGFYPEYWEYCKALWRPEWDSEWIRDGLVDKVLEPYLKEVALIMNTSYTIF
ncbi:phosphotransferase enzyme family protein [Chaetomium strumarium]|uniref:Phosphotransferase enzyme family protein n=1 Tax=Chaetomium strumarium TaxID=1170767 RepID=A0AAJ0GML5_9PEZI|nr:phosphotransferase enzyme family protein [Chaetomium strumarium]